MKIWRSSGVSGKKREPVFRLIRVVPPNFGPLFRMEQGTFLRESCKPCAGRAAVG